MLKKAALSLALVALSVLGANADPRSGPGRTTIVEQPWGTIFCADKCSITPDPSGMKYTVTTPDGPVAVLRQGEWWHIQAPGGSLMRLRTQESGRGLETLIQLGRTNYRMFKRYGEVEWNFPDDKVYYKTLDGNLRDVLGSKGSVTVRRNFTRNTYVVEGDQGMTEYELLTIKAPKTRGPQKKPTYKLKVVDGEKAERYEYLVRGMTFELGSVGLFLPLTPGKFTNALEWNRTMSFKAPVTPFDAKKKPAAPPSESASDDYDRDPLRLKMKSTRAEFKAGEKDPLRATTDPKNDEVLKAKDFDFKKPNPDSP